MPRVLIIDDDPDTRNVVGLILRAKGVETDEAANGEEGLEKARQNPPDLFLCDLDMPVLDGIETLAEIRRHPLLKYIPFILITAMATEAQEQSMMRGGADGVLRKPFAFAALWEIVQLHLRGSGAKDPASLAGS